MRWEWCRFGGVLWIAGVREGLYSFTAEESRVTVLYCTVCMD